MTRPRTNDLTMIRRLAQYGELSQHAANFVRTIPSKQTRTLVNHCVPIWPSHNHAGGSTGLYAGARKAITFDAAKKLAQSLIKPRRFSSFWPR